MTFRNQGKLGWNWDAATKARIQDKFAGMPLVNVSDAVCLLPKEFELKIADGKEHHEFLPRRYAQTWAVTTRLESGDMVMSPLFGPLWYY